VTPQQSDRSLDDALRWLAEIPLPRHSDEITTRLPAWVLEAARGHTATLEET